MPDESTLVVKAILDGAEWELDVLGCPYGGPLNGKDAQGEYFDGDTKFHEDRFGLPPAVYYHGFDDAGEPATEPVFIGRTLRRWRDNAGEWFRVRLDQASAEAKRVWEAAKQGTARASSGAVAHLVRRAPDGHILHWPVAELSVFETDGNKRPANAYAVAMVAAKARWEAVGMALPDDEDDATKKVAVEDMPDDQRRAVFAHLAEEGEDGDEPWQQTPEEYGVPDKPEDTPVPKWPHLERIAREAPEQLTERDKSLLAELKEARKKHAKYIRDMKVYVDKSNEHLAMVRKAISEGKRIPRRVLDAYPFLRNHWDKSAGIDSPDAKSAIKTRSAAGLTLPDIAESEAVAEGAAQATQSAAGATPELPTQSVTEDDMSEELTALQTDLSAIKAQLAEVSAIKAMLDEMKAQPAETKAGYAVPKDPDDHGPFKSLGEQLMAIRAAAQPGARADEKLFQVKVPLGLGAGQPSDGGFLLQPNFVAGLWQRAYDGSDLLQRCFKVPIGDNNDSVKINGIDETSRATGSRWGGVQSYWVAEAATITPSQPHFRQITLEPKKEAVLIYATSEMLRNPALLEAVVSQVAGAELMFRAENAVFSGDGAGKPLGFTVAPCVISVAAEGGQLAATVISENVLSMWAHLWVRSRRNAVWYIEQSVEAQLSLMQVGLGAAASVVYMPPGGLSAAPYGSLFGRPVIPIEHCAVLGTVNDIVLADMSQYAIADRGGVQAASSIHVQFVTDQSVFRFIYEIDGVPLWSSTLTTFAGGTVSPCITLATRS